MRNKTRVYLKAAQLIDEYEETLSCSAIYGGVSGRVGTWEDRVLYADTFNLWGQRGIDKIEHHFPDRDEARQFRVLLLCMMAACWRDI